MENKGEWRGFQGARKCWALCFLRAGASYLFDRRLLLRTSLMQPRVTGSHVADLSQTDKALYTIDAHPTSHSQRG